MGSTPVSLSPSPFTQILFIPKPRHHIQNYFIRINYKGFYPDNKGGLLRNFQCNLALSLKRQSLKFLSRQIKILSFNSPLCICSLKLKFCNRASSLVLDQASHENILLITFQNPGEASLSISVYTKYN